jgi:hypothetical protein
MLARTLLGALGAGSLALFATQASGQEIFGANFTHQLTPPESCNEDFPARLCSWAMMEAQGNPDHAAAPRTGRIAKIRLVACAPRNSFVLQVVRVNPTTQRAQVIRTGPVINYRGTLRNCTISRNFNIEEFNVDVPIRRGDRLSVVAAEVRFMYNPGSGPSKVFEPPLAEGGPARPATNHSGFLMLQAELAPP